MGYLAKLGATVVKIEPPNGDPLAQICPDWYHELIKGLTIYRLDLNSDDNRSELFKMLGSSDLLLTSSRPETLTHIGIERQQTLSRFPNLCQVAIVGFAGENSFIPGHDLNYQASCGLVEPPALPQTLFADLAGAECVVSAALAMLLKRSSQRKAAYCEVSLAESVAPFVEPLTYGLTKPGGILGGGFPRYNLYCARQGWIAVAALEPHFWQRLQQALQLDNPEYEELANCFLQRTAEEWECWAVDLDLPITVVC
jgi:crotonobetainyl-CoA:carnitine CoA-transferase CaiB-like acyl-CoA transferase